MPHPSAARAIACACLCFPLTATADDRIIVAATRAPLPLDQFTGDVSVIDAAQIAAAGQSTLADLLRLLPGVEVVMQGGPGQPATVFLRGANSNHTALLIDGVRQTSLNLGLGALQSLPLAGIERIEVVRAPASGLYGADAVGGVIHIVTRAAGRTLRVGAGDHGRRRIDASVAFDLGGWRGALAAGEDRSGGFDAVLPTNFAHHPDDDHHRQRSAQARFSRDWGETGDIALAFLGTRNDTGIDAEFPPYSTAPDARARQDVKNLSLAARWRIASAWTSRVQLGSGSDRFRWIDTRSFDDVVETTLRSASWLNDVSLAAGTLRIGAETQTQELSADATAYDARKRRTTSLLTGWAMPFGGAGAHALRIDARRDDVAGHGATNSGNVGLSLRLDPLWQADLRWGRAFKLPTFNDLYYVDPWGYFVANPDLAPETAHTAEAGLIRRSGVDRLALRAFTSRIDDLIANHDPDGFLGPLPGTVINAGRARIDGATLDAATVWAGWQWRVAATLQHATDADSGDRLPRRARAHGSVTAERSVGAWAFSAELAAQGARFDSLPNNDAGRLPGYATVNLRAAWSPLPDWRVQARWNNVFDRDYALAQGYPVPGSNVFVDVQWSMP